MTSPQHVLIAATHTHTGPAISDLLGCPRDAAYAAWVPLKISDAVELALDGLQPAAVAPAVGREERVSFNRRYWMRDGTVRMNPGCQNPDIVRPAGPIDPELGMIGVTKPDGTPLGVVLSFALHYMGADSSDGFSADYFGHVSRLLQQVYGANFVTIFFNGASGDINRIDTRRPPVRDWGRQSRKVATVLGGQVVRHMSLICPQEDVPLGGLSKRVRFHRQAITLDDVNMAHAILRAPRGAPFPENKCEPGPFSWLVGHLLPLDLGHLYAMETLHLAAMPEILETEVQVLRIGDTGVVGLPGEIFCSLGLDLKARSPLPLTLIAELANDYIGYVPTTDAIEKEGGYETWAARSALPTAGVGELLVDTAIELLDQVSQ